MSEENKIISKKVYEEVWVKGNLDAVDELFADDFVNHSQPPNLPQGREGFKMLAGGYQAAFPNMKMVVEDTLADGDRVVIRWISTGKHEGEFNGIAATDKDVRVTGISIDRISGGKVAESWGEFDLAGLLMQLGAVSAPGG